MKKISIVIPAYNEEKFIGALLTKVLQVPIEKLGFEKEIIVVDDGSRDRTGEVVSKFIEVRYIHQRNQGKGRAVQTGIQQATGDFVLVQDADLEYDPQDYLPMLEALAGDTNVAVYGSRVLNSWRRQRGSLLPGKHEKQDFGPWLAGVGLSGWTLLLYGKWISDTLTGYKIYPTSVLKKLAVKTNGFETDHEITAKLIRLGVPIREVAVSYHPRTKEEGKKIRFRDGLIALWTLARYRTFN